MLSSPVPSSRRERAIRRFLQFPAAFWVANTIELFERAAYYGTFIALTLYLTDVAGFSDVEAGWVGALFTALIYLLPFVAGAIADRIGFRRALLVAFALLAAGYGGLGMRHEKAEVLVSLVLVAVGGAFVKPIITGTVARCSDEATRARAYSLFYMMVNIGSFSGKTIARPVRVGLGLDFVPLYSAGAALVALVLVAFLYWPREDGQARPRNVADILRGLAGALSHGRFLSLILITAGFWILQGQLYASMPKYVIRMVGPDASPEWYANVNPLVVVLLVVPITHVVRHMAPVKSIGLALGLVPFAAVAMALSPVFPSELPVLGFRLHPVTVAMILGIAIVALGECFLSPRYFEYASRQAPPGQEGLFLGYAHLNTFFAWLTGFVISGYLLDAFCPDPRKLSAAEQVHHLAALAGEGPMPPAYAHAHYIWFVFAGIGAAALAMLIVFRFVTERR